MSQYLFAYGTLQPGRAPKEIARVVAKLSPVGKGHVHGVLYDLGEYPGAILNLSSNRRITGTVLRLPDAPGILQQLDKYEGFDPGAPATSLFLRKLHPVALAADRILQCWIYVYNRKPGTARILTSGSYRKKLYE